jgi:hypothetical protein
LHGYSYEGRGYRIGFGDKTQNNRDLDVGIFYSLAKKYKPVESMA